MQRYTLRDFITRLI